MVTDKGPLRYWLYLIGKSEEYACTCGSEVAQTVHKLETGKVVEERRCGKARIGAERYVISLSQVKQSEAGKVSGGKDICRYIYRGWHDPGVGQSSRAAPRECVPSPHAREYQYEY